MSKPSDLIPELQGRFPIRVELESLTAADFETILTQPKNALILQYKALLATEDVKLDFSPTRSPRSPASPCRSTTDRKHRRPAAATVLEKLFEDIGYARRKTGDGRDRRRLRTRQTRGDRREHRSVEFHSINASSPDRPNGRPARTRMLGVRAAAARLRATFNGCAWASDSVLLSENGPSVERSRCSH